MSWNYGAGVGGRWFAGSWFAGIPGLQPPGGWGHGGHGKPHGWPRHVRVVRKEEERLLEVQELDPALAIAIAIAMLELD